MISIRRTSSSSSLCHNDHPAEDEDEDEDEDVANKKPPAASPPAFASLETLPSQRSAASSCVGSEEIVEQQRWEIAESLLALSGPPLTAQLITTPPPLDLLPSVPPPPPLATSNGSLQDVSNQTVPTGGGPSKTNPRHTSWAAKFELLCEFKKTHGHCLVVRAYPELCHWVNSQRQMYKLVEAGQSSPLTADRIASLNGIGFVWDRSMDAIWTEKYNDLLKYKEAYGHCLVPPIYPADPDLGKWVTAQRDRYRVMKEGLQSKWKKAFPAYRVELLEDAGFFAGCTKPENKLGNTLDAAEQVEPRDSSCNGSLQDVSNQTVPAGGGPSKTNQRHAGWAAKFELLCEFKKTHGHCLVLQDHPELGSWVRYQRQMYKLVEAGQSSPLTADRIASMNGIGFVWDRSRDARWTEKYNDLLKYKEAYGHCLVPRIYLADPDLGKWVAAQRDRYRVMKEGRQTQWQKALPAYRVELLEDAGFFAGCTKPENKLGNTLDAAEQVEPRDSSCNGSLQDISNQAVLTGGGPSKTNQRHAGWAAKFELLCEFKKTHGHCLVRQDHPELGFWVSRQRQMYDLVETGQSSPSAADRIASLNGIGFVWGGSMGWTKKYNDLLKYKEAYGHCLVPTIFPADPDLGKWVRAQRQTYQYRAMKQGQQSKLQTALTASRAKLLEDAGFFAGRTKPEKKLGTTLDVSSSSFDSIKNPLSQEVDDCDCDTALFKDLIPNAYSPHSPLPPQPLARTGPRDTLIETRPIGGSLRNHHAFKCNTSSRQDEDILVVNEEVELSTKTMGDKFEGTEQAAPRPAIFSSSFASLGTLPGQERDSSCVTSEEIIQKQSDNVERLVAPSDQSPENESGTAPTAIRSLIPTSIGAREALANISNQSRPTGNSSENHCGRKRKATPLQDEDARRFHEEQVWQSNFQDLGRFEKQNFHNCIHESHPLYHWMNDQRIQYFKWCVGGIPHTMTIQRYTALQSLWFPFVQGEWFRGLDQFLRFKKQHGCISNLYLWKANERPPLQHWVYMQKYLYDKQTSGCQDAHIALSSEQIDLLDACEIIDKVQPLRSPAYRDAAPSSSLN
jgi:Helicase associated domain